MKKAIAIFLTIFILLSSPGVCYADGSKNGIASLPNDQGIVSLTGTSMTVDSFNTMFCGEPIQRKQYNTSYGKKAELQIENLILDGYNISFDAYIKQGNSISGFSAKGELFDGYKREKGLCNYVGVFDNTSASFKILLFEVCNDSINKKSTLITTDSKVKQKPLLRFYILDNSGNIYIFETSLPSSLSSLSTARGEYAESSHDALWFMSITTPPTTEEIEATPENIAKLKNETSMSTIVPMANGSFTTYNFGSIRTMSYYVGSDKYQFFSLPYAMYKHLNVRPESTWILNFKVAEHTTINGVTYRSVDNVFRYKNVDLRVAAGGNTTFINTIRQGRMIDLNGGIKQAGSQIGSHIMQKIISSIPYMPAVSTVVGWLNTASQSTTITLGSNAVTLSGGFTSAVGMQIEPDYSIYKCTDYDGVTDIGHYLYYQVRAQYEGTNGQVSTNTTGMMRVSFTTYNAWDYSSTPTTKDFSLVYTAAAN